jgi:hypothetical protein
MGEKGEVGTASEQYSILPAASNTQVPAGTVSNGWITSRKTNNG